jgi:peptidoglycan glycosyltransferase
VTRQYLYPEMNSALGYASLRYGLGGAEAAYNITLRGDDRPLDFGGTLGKILTHQPGQGSDIQLTFDQIIQREVIQAMGPHQGAVVVLAVPSGEVLAMVSLPTFNPNTLDASWETLISAAGKPFFNRSLQGAYQPGGIMQTFLLAGGMLSSYPLNQRFEDATQPVKVGEVELECLTQPNKTTLTLGEAYVLGCPYPFAKLVEQASEPTLQSIFDTFRLHQPPTLPGFVLDPARLTSTPQSSPVLSSSAFIETALGQGEITVNPLQMAITIGAILNEGNAPTPYTLLATRAPESDVWTPDNTPHPSIPWTTAEVARNLQNFMREAVTEGVAHSATQTGIDMGGHAALSYSGEGTQAWFIGFATLGNGAGIAVAVVIENSADPDTAASIGGQALAAAHTRLTLPATGGD